MHNKIRMVALDLDGTLLNNESMIDDETSAAVRECIKRGIKVVLSSGRNYHSIKRYVKQLGINNEQITLNGGVIINPGSGEIVRKVVMPGIQYGSIIKKLKDRKIPAMVFTSGHSYFDEECEEFEIMKSMDKDYSASFKELKEIDNPVKVIAIVRHTRFMEEIKSSLRECGIKIMKTGDNFLEIQNEAISKGIALKYLAEKYGILRDEVFAAGDSENDLEMIQYAGCGVAMGNAFQNVKEISNYVTDTNENKGVLKALYKYVI